ncbi:MAG: PDZ domain-containing protein [Planctomycetota bacterium]
MLIDKLEKSVCVFGGLVIFGMVFLVVKMTPSMINRGEIIIENTTLDIPINEPKKNLDAVDKHEPLSTSDTPPRRTSVPPPNPSKATVVNQTQYKKVLPSHNTVEERKIDTSFRERYSKYANVFEELKNAEGEIANTPYGTGIRLTSVVRNSIIERIGFKHGDVLLSINGRTLDEFTEEPDDIYKEGEKLYEQLKGQELFEIEVIRDGQPSLLRYYLPLK